MNDYERILDTISLADVVGRHVVLANTGETAVGTCPFAGCGPASLTVYKKQGAYYCAGCGATGDAVDFLQNLLSISRHEALSQLANLAGVAAPCVEPGALAIRKEDAVEAIWEFCAPATGIGEGLQNLGWDTRSYDAEMLEMAVSTLGPLRESVHKSGIAHVDRSGLQSSTLFQPYDNAFVLAGRRLIGNGPAITGFAVIAGLSKMHVTQRMSSATSPASVIVNQGTFAQSNTVEQIFITDSPLRAFKASKKIAALSPTAPQWRPQDVRDVMAFFSKATFILDISKISDGSLQEWILQNRAQVSKLEGIGDFLNDNEIDLSSRDDHADGRLATALRAAATAHDLLGALTNPGGKTGPITSVSPATVAPIDPLNSGLTHYVLGTNSCLLEAALLHLPMVDPSLWDGIPVDEFGEHAAIAAALGAFRNDATMSVIEHHRAHAAFWVFVERFNAAAVPQALVNFWQGRLAQNALYWQPVPDPTSLEGKMCAEEISALIAFFSDRIARRRRTTGQKSPVTARVTEQVRSAFGRMPQAGNGV